MAEHDADKSFEATQYRRDQAREKGFVARSHDLAAAVILLVGIGLLLWLGESLLDALGGYTQRQLGGVAWLTLGPDSWTAHVVELGGLLAPSLLSMLGLLVVAAIAGNVLQTGLLFQPQRLVPDWSHVSIFRGFSRIFSLQGAARLAFGLLKLVVASAVASWALYAERETLLNLSGATVPVVAKFLVEIVLWTSLKVAVALLVLALADFVFQKWKYEQDLRMTSQEIREEMKDLQGDPQIIARRRQVQRQMVAHRIKSAVPKADVVVTNPTELAVAIQYDPQEMAAPVVVAKGAGALAAHIRRLAMSHGIPIVENKPLARELYKEVDVNRAIPAKSYAAVAEVLAYVYRLKGKTAPGMR